MQLTLKPFQDFAPKNHGEISKKLEDEKLDVDYGEQSGAIYIECSVEDLVKTAVTVKRITLNNENV